MGGHYGSIHVRTDDAEAVQSAVFEIAREKNVRFLVAPAIKGWVSVFPWNNGVDPAVSERLATLLPDADVIHGMVHDDDVFAYWYYQNGELKDLYNSCPNYFDETNQDPRGGNARAFEHLLPKKGAVAKLQLVLDRERMDFEMERFDEFAKLLELPNAVTAYEYLNSGDQEGIKHRRKFVHVPDLSGERDAEREAAAKVRSGMKRLKSEGTLIIDLIAGKTSHKLFFQIPVWCIDPVRNEVLFCWNEVNLGGRNITIPVSRFASPKWEAVPTGIQLQNSLSNFVISHDGKWMAMGHAYGNWLAQLWNLEDSEIRVDLPVKMAARALCFSPDDRRLFCASETEVIIVSVPDQKVIATVQLEGAVQEMVVHPDGKALVLTDTGGILQVVCLDSFRVISQAWIAETNGILPKGLRNEIIGQSMQSFTSSLQPHLGKDEMDKYQRDCERHFLPKDPIRTITFTQDGKRLLCGTRDGMHVLEWEDLPVRPEVTRVEPRFSFETEPVVCDLGAGRTRKSRLTYAVLFDAPRQRVLFSGIDGKIYYFELVSGKSGVLFVPPEPLPMTQLDLLPDRSALVATVMRIELRKKWPPHFQIWNYPALCRTAGIPF